MKIVNLIIDFFWFLWYYIRVHGRVCPTPVFFYSAIGRIFYSQTQNIKRNNMNNKIEYVADGNACEFVFTFPFFTTKDIVVSRNGKEITSGFTITASENAENADVPFVGGTIRFLNAPAKSEIITICRKISLNRIIDYQPTTRTKKRGLECILPDRLRRNHPCWHPDLRLSASRTIRQ